MLPSYVRPTSTLRSRSPAALTISKAARSWHVSADSKESSSTCHGGSGLSEQRWMSSGEVVRTNIHPHMVKTSDVQSVNNIQIIYLYIHICMIYRYMIHSYIYIYRVYVYFCILPTFTYVYIIQSALHIPHLVG